MRFNKDGLTLVEIVVAIGLLGIIAVLFLTAFSGQFSMFSRTRQITDNLFRSQEIIEKDIDNIKTKLVENPSSISNPTVSYNLFSASGTYSRQVSGFVSDTLSHSSDTRLVAVVSDGRLPAFPVPEIVSVDLKIVRNGTTATAPLDNHENVAYPGLSLKATSDIEENSVYYTSRHEWYVSNPGFNIPVIPTSDANYDVLVDSDLDLGRLYPIFPNDYSPIPIEAYSGMSAESILASLSETYAGRHIIYKITPFAASGRMGDSVVSDPVFMSGPAVNSGKILHLDASLISKADFVGSDSALYASTGDQVKLWEDYSEIGNTASQANLDMMPTVVEDNYNDVSYVWGKALIGESTGSELTVSSFDSDGTLSNYTVIFSAKRLNNSSYNLLTVGDGSSDVWNIGFVDGDMVFDGTSYDPASVNAVRNISADGSWHIYMLDFKSDGTVSVFIDEETSPSAIGTISSGYSIDDITISLNDSFELAEILMYKDLTADNMAKVRDFLKNKYHPDPAEHAVTINYLLPVADQVLIQGDPEIGLPGSVLAHMTNGSVQNVAVNWDAGYDPNIVGTYTSTARAVMDTSKTITATVHVLGIDAINLSPSSIAIIEGDDYALPVRLPASVSNSTISRTIDILVNWYDITLGLPGSAISNLSTLGTTSGTPHTIRAYADADNMKYADLSVDVTQYIPVSRVEINSPPTSISLGVDNYLVATVYPVDATNKNVTWATTNPGQISVSESGTPGTVIIRGYNPDESIDPVKSTITVRTEDGGYEDSCEINVNIPLTGLSFAQESVSMKRGITYDASDNLVFAPNNATDKSVLWSTTNSYVITVDPDSGVVSSHNNGKADLIAKSVEDNSIVAEIEISVAGNSGCG